MYATKVPSGLVWPRLMSPRVAMLRLILRQMEKSERQAPHIREAAQRAQLHSLLSHAFEEVPFYKERLRLAGFRPDHPLTDEIWHNIPVITRQEVQRDSESLKARNVPSGHGLVRASATSGSTGIPLKVIKTELSGLFWDAVTVRENLWQKRDLSRPWHSIRYFKDGGSAYPSGVTTTSWGRAASTLGPTGPGFGLSILTDPLEQVDWLQRNPPTYLLTYPSNLKALLDATVHLGCSFPELRQVVTLAESVSSELRSRCREQWGVPIRDMYSATEVGYMALQAPQGDHYLVPEEVVRLELLDDAGRSVEIGETGKVVATPLHNYAMPLIRYAIGDYAERGDRSPCGRTLPVINRILGRVRNMLTYPDGRKSWPLFIDSRFRDHAPVNQFRVIQHTVDTLELQVAAERALNAGERNALVKTLQESMQYPFKIEITEHAEIARGAGGKYEDFRSNVE